LPSAGGFCRLPVAGVFHLFDESVRAFGAGVGHRGGRGQWPVARDRGVLASGFVVGVTAGAGAGWLAAASATARRRVWRGSWS
jgi:hypothetical protein